MTRRFMIPVLAMLMLTVSLAADDKSASKEKLSDTQRREIIRGLMAEPVYIHRAFPMGMSGLRIEEGRVMPSELEVRQMAAQYGTAAKPGDRARITNVRFLSKGIVFEINGGPVKKKKWYDRLEVGGLGTSATTSGPGAVDQAHLYTNAQGSFVLLQFKDHIPALTPDQVKAMLEPAFDFKAGSVAEAFERAMPPKIADAIKNHRALVGMDRDMVTYAKGRPPRRYRDRDGDTEYEEWIYGQPPEPVEFVRFLGDKVARIEVMQVDGQKVVRTANEVGDLSGEMSTMAKENQAKPAEDESTRSAPSLLRPGEAPEKVTAVKPVNNQVNQQMPPGSMPPSATIPGADQQGPSQAPGGPPMGGPPMGGPPH